MADQILVTTIEYTGIKFYNKTNVFTLTYVT